MKTVTIQRSNNTTFETTQEWADENADLLEKQGSKIIATPAKVKEEKNVEPLKIEKDGKEADKGK